MIISFLITSVFAILNSILTFNIIRKYKKDFIKSFSIFFIFYLYQFGVVIKLFLIKNYPDLVIDNFFFTINASSINLSTLIYINIINIIFYLLFIFILNFKFSFLKELSNTIIKYIKKIPTSKIYFQINNRLLILFIFHFFLLFISFKYKIGLHGLGFSEDRVQLPKFVGGLIVYIRNYVVPTFLVGLINNNFSNSKNNLLLKSFILIFLLIDIFMVTFIETSKILGVLIIFSVFLPNILKDLNHLFKKIYIFSRKKFLKIFAGLSILLITFNISIFLSRIGKLFRDDIEIDLKDNYSINPLLSFLGLMSKRVEGAREIILNTNTDININPFSNFFFTDKRLLSILYSIDEKTNQGVTLGLLGQADLTNNIFISFLFIAFIAFISNFMINFIKSCNLNEASSYFLIINFIVLIWGGATFTLLMRFFISLTIIAYFNKIFQLKKSI